MTTSVQSGGHDHLRAALIDLLTSGFGAARPDTLTAVGAERRRQHTLRGDHAPDSPCMANSQRLAVLMEEVGELAHLLTHDGTACPQALRDELVPVAAVALAWLDRINQWIERIELDEPPF